MKLPALWRKRDENRRYVGNYIATIKGTDVNLKTKSATKAEKRLLQAIAGKRDFLDEDAADAAAALDPDVGAAASDSVRPLQAGPEPPAAAAAAPTPTAAPAAAASAPLQPDAVITPGRPPLALPAPASSSSTAEEEAAATNAAAAEGAAGAGADAKQNAGATMPGITPDMLEGLLVQAAEGLVEIQLTLQAWIVKKKTGKDAGRIPETAPIRGLAAQGWVMQFKQWCPDLSMVAPWMFAVGMTAAALPYQAANATKPEPNPATGAGFPGAAGDVKAAA